MVEFIVGLTGISEVFLEKHFDWKVGAPSHALGVLNWIKKTKGKYTCIVDRIEAIKYAINMADKKDIIVLAGKGHEPYQEINGKKYPFDERIIVNDIINGESK